MNGDVSLPEPEQRLHRTSGDVPIYMVQTQTQRPITALPDDVVLLISREITWLVSWDDAAVTWHDAA